MEARLGAVEDCGKMKFPVEIVLRIRLIYLGESDKDYGRVRFDAKALCQRFTEVAAGCRFGEEGEANYLSRQPSRLPIRKFNRQVFCWELRLGRKELLTI